jgi:hypothetical protein
MIYDYVVVAILLFIIHIILNNWPICIIATTLIWFVFAVRIGNVRILQLGDLMPGEQEQEA